MSDLKICPECNYERKPDDNRFSSVKQCPNCGAFYENIPIKKEKESVSDYSTAETQKSGISAKPETESPITAKKLIVFSLVAGAMIFSFLFSKKGTSTSAATILQGSYQGEIIADNKKLFVEVEVDSQNKVTKIFSKAEYTYSTVSEETYLWEHPGKVELNFIKDITKSEYDLTSNMKIDGNKIEIAVSSPRMGLSLSSKNELKERATEITDSKLNPYETNKEVFSTRFNLRIFKNDKINADKKDFKFTEHLTYREFCRHCQNACSTISKLFSAAATSRLFVVTQKVPHDFNKCSMRLGNSFRYKLNFNIYFPPDFQNDLQQAFNNKISLNTLYFEPDNNVAPSIDTSENNPLVRLSLNTSGYGVYNSSQYGVAIPIRKIDSESNKEEIKKALEEWYQVFRPLKDPRIMD
jgi:hypothetical protein